MSGGGEMLVLYQNSEVILQSDFHIGHQGLGTEAPHQMMAG